MKTVSGGFYDEIYNVFIHSELIRAIEQNKLTSTTYYYVHELLKT